MSDFTRVKDNDTGHEYTVPTSLFELYPDHYTEVDKPATDSVGEPLPAKHKISAAKKAAAKKAATVADTNKE